MEDNLSKNERKVLKEMKQKKDIIYMWEDKGLSFTKMTRNQYVSAGEKELESDKFYKTVDSDPSKGIKARTPLTYVEIVSIGYISFQYGNLFIAKLSPSFSLAELALISL